MRYTFLTFLLAFFFSLSAQQVTISGTVDHPNSNYFLLHDMQGKMIDSVSLDKDLSLSMTVNVEEGRYSLNDGTEYMEVYLKPGDSLHFTLDAEKFDETFVFSGRGAKVNNYHVKTYLVDEERNGSLGYWQLMKLPEERFLNVIDSLENADILLLGQYLEPEDDIYSRRAKEIYYGKVLNLAGYEGGRRYITKDPEFTVSENFPDAFKGLNLNDVDAVDIGAYRNVISSYVNTKIYNDKAYLDSLGFLVARLETIDKVLEEGPVKEMAIQEGSDYLYRSSKNRNLAFDLYMRLSNDEEFKQKMRETEDALQRISRGMPSPELILTDFNGNEFKLSDQKGKLVYIDVWATWCGPCIAELPHLKEVQKQYEGNDIVFVSVAWNDNYENWRSMVEKKELGGVQLFAQDSDSEFFETYRINAIPTFILLGRDGMIIDSDAMRPSNEELKTQLNELLGIK